MTMRVVALMLFLGGILTHGINFDLNEHPFVRFNTTSVSVHYFSENPSAYDYHAQYGIRVAERIEKAEKNYVALHRSGIIGGDLAFNGDVPYMAGVIITLEAKYISVCGSSLLSNTKLVTAAHCWRDGKIIAHSFTIVLGSDMLFFGGTRIATNNVAPHYNWRPESSAQNDIALITIPSVAFTVRIRPIELPSGSLLKKSFAGAVAQATGFGLLADVQEWDNWFLYNVELKIMKNSDCFQYYDSLTDNMMCASGAEGRSTCHVDMGGPLVFCDDGRDVLIGIASFVSKYGCEVGRPSGYTRVAPYVKWIQSF